MKKVKILGISLIFCLALSMLALLPFNTVSASAAVNPLDTMNIENVTQALFGWSAPSFKSNMNVSECRFGQA